MLSKRKELRVEEEEEKRPTSAETLRPELHAVHASRGLVVLKEHIKMHSNWPKAIVPIFHDDGRKEFKKIPIITRKHQDDFFKNYVSKLQCELVNGKCGLDVFAKCEECKKMASYHEYYICDRCPSDFFCTNTCLCNHVKHVHSE